ncbi:hypothetical protein [Magnetospira thiophila]
MKKIILWIGLLLWSATAGAQDGAFLSILEDVPLMSGLSEALDAGMVFDSPQGRLAETTATGAVTAEQVSEFYDQTLPQLGWTRAASGQFLREGESLGLTIESVGSSAVSVRFELKPGPKY